METKFIFVTGGVLSGLGKGILAGSLGNILQHRGYKVSVMKFDPYLNVDAGTLNPGEHGECFVTSDGAETDLDLGHYERFLDIELNRYASVMSGSIYQAVISKERQGSYLGKTVQVIPHVTGEIKKRLYDNAQRTEADIMIVEIGGTVGDIEGQHFIEAIRQVGWEKGPQNTLFVHLGYLPYLASSQELKSKPVQASINDLRTMGIQPALVFCRADRRVAKSMLRKVALFGGLKEDAVIPLPTAKTIYEVPQTLLKYRVDHHILELFGLPTRTIKNGHWKKLVERIKTPQRKTVNVALVGKYMTMKDTYFSVIEALKSASWTTGYNLNLHFTNSELIEKNGPSCLEQFDGICAPGGFGSRGIEGIITAIKFAREKKIPFLGLCLGMQLACVEYARNVLKLADAHSTEMDPSSPDPVIDFSDGQKKKVTDGNYGGTMRLGNYPCTLEKDTQTHSLYQSDQIIERHRHRYEFNNSYRQQFLDTNDFLLSGICPDNDLVEIIELKEHPFFIACQFHPEFKSRPNRSHPLFLGFIEAVISAREHGGPTLI